MNEIRCAILKRLSALVTYVIMNTELVTASIKGGTHDRHGIRASDNKRSSPETQSIQVYCSEVYPQGYARSYQSWRGIQSKAGGLRGLHNQKYHGQKIKLTSTSLEPEKRVVVLLVPSLESQPIRNKHGTSYKRYAYVNYNHLAPKTQVLCILARACVPKTGIDTPLIALKERVFMLPNPIMHYTYRSKRGYSQWL